MAVHGRQGFQSEETQTAMDWDCYPCNNYNEG